MFRGLLSAFLKPYDPQLAGYALDAEEEVSRGGDTDVSFFRLLYRLDPQLKAFCWKDRRFSGLAALGGFILNDARENGVSGGVHRGGALAAAHFRVRKADHRRRAAV
ncbi:MAG: hypothetical protein V8T38_05385 [Oscillospiraceae bacterium]